VQAIELIYGSRVSEDIAFCTRHNTALNRYAHGIMTIQGAPRQSVVAIAADPMSVHGWVHSLQEHPEDVEVLREFFARFVSYYDAAGAWQ
jgi:hypothetical protein